MRSTILLLAATLPGACSRPPEPASAIRLIDRVPSTDELYTEKELETLRADGHVAAHVVLNGEGRPALVPDPPTRLSFAVELPTDAHLRFAIAGIPKGGAEFRISLRTAPRDRDRVP